MTKKEEDKSRVLELALSEIEKQFGKGSIMKLGEGNSFIGKIETIQSGSLGLDLALGIGGYARGRVVEIFGQLSLQ